MWKILPYDYYEVDAVEGWLDEQSRKGLRLRKLRGAFCCFDRCEPFLGRYRLHVKPQLGYQGEEERIAQYREMGWEYVTMVTPKVDLYCAISPEAVEMNTDEELLRQTLRSTLRTLLFSTVCCFITAAFCIAALVETWRGSFGFWSFYMEMGIVPLIAFALDALIFLWFGVTQLISWYSIRHRSLLQRSYHTPQRSSRRRRSRIAWLCTGAVVFAAMIVSMIVMDGKTVSGHDGTLPPCPLPMLSVIAPQEAQSIEFSDSFRIDFPLYHHTKYEQYGPGDDGLTRYGCAIDLLDIDSAELAEKVAAERTRGWSSLAPNIWFSTYSDHITHDGREYDFIHQSLTCLQGNRIIEYSYYGSGDLKAVLPYLG